jgi:general secretion pathway protein J
MKPRTRPRSRGFTLIELLVALTMMALLALMSWRGLDGMVRTRVQTEARADEVLALQVGLSQWAADLDAIVQTPQLNALDWNGSVLRLTRRSSAAATDGVLVVAWTRRVVDGRGQWLRWQSPPLTGRGSLSDAWQQASIWAQNAGEEQRAARGRRGAAGRVADLLLSRRCLDQPVVQRRGRGRNGEPR